MKHYRAVKRNKVDKLLICNDLLETKQKNKRLNNMYNTLSFVFKGKMGGEGHGHNVLVNGFSNSGRLHKKSLITAVPSKKGTREWVRMERRQFTGFSFFTLNFFFTMYLFYFLKQCKA